MSSQHTVRLVTTLPDVKASSTRPYLPTHRAPGNLHRRREQEDAEEGEEENEEEEEEAWTPPLTLGDPAVFPAPTLATGASIAPTAPPTSAPPPSRAGTAASQGQLIRAAAKGDAREVERLISAGVDVNESHSGVTPLHAAARNGHVSVMNWLIYAGADVDASSADDGDTPLHVAMVTWQNLRMVELLIEVGRCRLIVSKTRFESAFGFSA